MIIACRQSKQFIPVRNLESVIIERYRLNLPNKFIKNGGVSEIGIFIVVKRRGIVLVIYLTVKSCDDLIVSLLIECIEVYDRVFFTILLFGI